MGSIFIRVVYIVLRTPFQICMIYAEYQFHRINRVVNRSTRHRPLTFNTIHKTIDLDLPGGITVISREFLKRIAPVIVRIRPDNGQRFGPVTLGSR